MAAGQRKKAGITISLGFCGKRGPFVRDAAAPSDRGNEKARSGDRGARCIPPGTGTLPDPGEKIAAEGRLHRGSHGTQPSNPNAFATAS